MGDSYTAGPVIPIQLLDPVGCWRSDHNYPHLVARARGSALRDRSCSGADTNDLSSPQAVFGGTNPPQLDALDSGVGTVSLQIGGNDIGFSEILQRCTAVCLWGRRAVTSTPPEASTRSAGGSRRRAPKVAAASGRGRPAVPAGPGVRRGVPGDPPGGAAGLLAGDADHTR